MLSLVELNSYRVENTVNMKKKYCKKSKKWEGKWKNIVKVRRVLGISLGKDMMLLSARLQELELVYIYSGFMLFKQIVYTGIFKFTVVFL